IPQLVEAFLKRHFRPGDIVYDPFVGSGTTIIAAEMTGRVCHAIEIDPAYVDVAVKRWQEFTGETAKLQTSGQSFGELVSRQDRLHNQDWPAATQAHQGTALSSRAMSRSSLAPPGSLNTS
ncbi:MAG: DNA methyltransferase, partial [Methyloceanibacter sp.]